MLQHRDGEGGREKRTLNGAEQLLPLLLLQEEEDGVLVVEQLLHLLLPQEDGEGRREKLNLN